MNERKLFWLGFCGGIIRIFGTLALLLAACMVLTAALRGEWLPLLMTLPPSLILYLFGWALETISEIGARVNKLEEQNRKSTSTETFTPEVP